MYFLGKSVRFRAERRSIYICDCRNLLNYEVPLYCLPLLNRLKEGYDENEKVGIRKEKEIFDDLKEAGLVVNNPMEQVYLNENIWESLQYSENEFYPR